MHIREQIISPHSTERRRLLQAINRHAAKAAGLGVTVSVESGFQDFKRLNRCLDKKPLTPNFDPDTWPLQPADGFWMRGFNEHGDVVMTQAARRYDCHAQSVAELHRSLRAFYASPDAHAEQGEVCRSPALAAQAIRGCVCYHGELWLAPAYRGRGLSDCLPKLLMAIVLLKWAPDYLFGMAQSGICTKGVAARYGYLNMQPGGMIWSVPSQGTLDEWIIWNNRAQLRLVVMRP